ncbi:MAG: DUF4139 domain-containing protein [Sphingomonadales bacterium]|nr:DUF4139 domain-containing protein [Sphingomonadales bacterium]
MGLVASAAAAEPPAGQGDVALTIYNNDLALVEDTRELALPVGRSRQEFPEVSAAIRPETVTLAGSGVGIVEQNFDYDLLTPEKLMDKAVGQAVTLVRTNPATGAETSEAAQVLANNGGTVVRVGQRIEVLGNYGGRVVFPTLPPNLRASPTLSVTLDAARAGRRPLTLRYLSTGFGWHADYVALFDERDGKLDMQGWVTLNNTSGTGFGNAKLLLVAGSPGAIGGGQNYGRQAVPGNRMGTESAARERLGDYYLYPLAGRTTVANAQQKQVSFLNVNGVPAVKRYLFVADWLENQTEARSVDTVLQFSSAKAGGLGDALPAGAVRVYMRDGRGQPQFIGENAIGHTPMGSVLAIKTGEAFDVKVRPNLEKRERITGDEWQRSAHWRVTVDGRTSVIETQVAKDYWRTTMTYTVTNARAEPVKVEVVQRGLDRWWGAYDVRVPSESVKGEQRSADERAWLVDVPANGQTKLTVQFDTRY